MFLNYFFKIKKFLFPITIRDPKNIYWDNNVKTYKFEQYKYLILAQRKKNSFVNPGDLINFIYSSDLFSNKFNGGDKLKSELPINKNVLNGALYEYSIDNKYKTPALIQREIYSTAVILFNPRIQDLGLGNRINAEKILFAIRNVS